MNYINPKKLLNSKWTALNPTNKERHFLVTKVETNAKGEVVMCMIQAVINKQSKTIDWQQLKNEMNWQPGWK
jgi:tryptophan-rich hypothetical protein